MFGFKSLILNLFAGLVLMLNQGQATIPHSQGSENEASITTNDYKGAAIIESGTHLYQILDSSQNSKLPFARFFEAQIQASASAHEPTLLYFSIGNAIEVEFTSTAIIFPFHCFT
ncbi:hypothetical protein M0G43_03705 [Subsaxibacter sp. CAU 1640]|uniref:hypothetical protein n=1 Tax=Subsaxibacter sp. CAU 1640 TaxID=2933271 RepID=UPI00200431A6|nr:hypothetical protein [Subsaxibacter sp. CAU 1640]MCK7589668.1 hypothetical protein [Subsaxibacter sp. CAU 1640]